MHSSRACADVMPTLREGAVGRIDTPDERSRKAGLAPKAMLRANKDTGNIQLDSETQLTGVPPQAWSYRLGNRSALEWILDQHKDKDAEGPDHPRKVQHLSLRGPQGEGDRSSQACDARERGDDDDCRGDEGGEAV